VRILKKIKYILPVLTIAIIFISLCVIPSSNQTPQPGVQTDEWWDTNYNSRRMITLTEPGISDRILEPIDVFLTFTTGEAIVDSIRVAFFNGSEWIEETSQIWNETTYTVGLNTYYNSCTVTFLTNITESSQKIYYIYYDDSYNIPAIYANKIWAYATNSSATPDTSFPRVYSNITDSYVYADMISIATTFSNDLASIILTDTMRPSPYSDWFGPVCSLITAKYNDSNGLDTSNGASVDSFMITGEFALDPFGRDPSMASSPLNRVNVGPNNPAEAWIPGGGSVFIEENGSLFLKIKIITTDGGFENADLTIEGWPMSMASSDDSVTYSNHGSGFFNYTYTYRFYYHGYNLLAELNQEIGVNIQVGGGGAQAHVKNYGDWPHVMAFSSIDGGTIQNMQAWFGSLKGLYTDPMGTRRHDFPLESWCAWYDNEIGNAPSIGLITTDFIIGWEVFSLAVGEVGPNLMLQQILREGHQGDFFIMPDGSVFEYHYFIYTSAFGTNYTEIRNMSSQLNSRVDVSQLDSLLVPFDNNYDILVPATDSKLIKVNFTDKVTGANIVGGTVEYTADWLPVGTWTNMFEISPGIYERSVTVPALTDLGDHYILVRAIKEGYPTGLINISTDIVGKTSVQLSDTAIGINQGQSNTLVIDYSRTDRGFSEPIENAIINVTGWGTNYQYVSSQGQYTITFQALSTLAEGTYNIQIEIGKESFQTQTFNISIVVSAPSAGPLFDLNYIMLGAAVGIVAAVGIYSGWNYYFRYPAVVRKIRKLRGGLRKMKVPAKPIDVKGRNETIIEFNSKDEKIIENIKTELVEEEFETSETTYQEPIESESQQTINEDINQISTEESELVGSTFTAKEQKLLKELDSLNIPDEEKDNLFNELRDLSLKEARKIIDSLKKVGR
jgi:hypothetical protein